MPADGSSEDVFVFPASFAQRRLWFLDRLEPNNPAYNLCLALRLVGSLDTQALERSLSEIARRHEVLRTTFTSQAGEPSQVVEPYHPLSLATVDLSMLPPAEREARALALAQQEARYPFDLSAEWLYRNTLVRLDTREHLLISATHHIASDQWSSFIFTRELSQLYTAFAAGQPSPLPELPVQYADYTLWQREWLQGEMLQQQLSYWRRQLQGVAPLELPTDRPRPPQQSFRGADLRVYLPPDLIDGLQQLSRRAGATLYMTMLAALQTLLHRYTGQEDIAVGSPIAGRTRVETEPLIGFFINALVMRTDFSKAEGGSPLTFSELLQRVRTMALAAYSHQDVPFEKLVEELQPQRDPSRSPFFQFFFGIHTGAGGAQEIILPGLECTRLNLDNETAKFDITFTVTTQPAGMTGWLNYNTDLFDAGTMQRMMGHYEVLLRAIVAHPEMPVAQLRLLTAAEQTALLHTWNNTATPAPPPLSIPQLFETQVEQTPDALALVATGLPEISAPPPLTYRELNRRANQLAHYLKSLGVGPDVPTGICLERSAESIIAVLGILKAGGACLPLDPTYPPERLAFMLQDARVPVVLTHGSTLAKLPPFSGQVVRLDADWPSISQQSTANPLDNTDPQQLLYVIYTSGSTGQPKGVAMPHGPLLNLITWQNRTMSMPPARGSLPPRTMQFAPSGFDVSFQEILGTLCYGGTLVLVQEEVRRDVWQLLQFLAEQAIERLYLPFVALELLATEAGQSASFTPAHLTEVITAGEQLRVTAAIATFFEQLNTPERKAAGFESCRLHNQYGPTETHVVTAYTLPGPPHTWPALPPIGRPIANTRIYLLDPQLEPAPVGVPGEIYAAGAAPARGYLHQPELTAQRFVPDPFSATEEGSRLYRTGDRARYLADGNIEFLGRSDDQVKVRGYRIEPGEIEAVLSRHPAIQACAVAVSGGGASDRHLVAYYVTAKDGQAPGVAELRGFLRNALPEYMVPALFASVTTLPLTASGKVDRQRLAGLEMAQPAVMESTAPRASGLAARLIPIWERVLQVRQVGMHDNFFDLGGHSLLAVRLFAEIEQLVGKELPGQRLPLALLFRAPTIAQLAEALQQETGVSPYTALVPLQPQGSRLPFFCVHGFGGGVIGYTLLARSLGEDQPVYALQSLDMDGSGRWDNNIVEMAARYLQEVRQFQPHGPYLLGGYCFGGTVAFEMAQQLQTQGEQVALLAMFDNAAPRSGYLQVPGSLRPLPRFLANLPYWLWDFVQLEPELRQGRIQRKTKSAWNSLRQVLRLPAPAPSPYTLVDILDTVPDVPPQIAAVLDAHFEAMVQYRPQVYPGRVVLFRSRRQPLFCSHDPAMQWHKLAQGGVEVHVVSGAHRNILEEPHVRSLAKALRGCLDRITPYV